jgi:hypothetical protein
VLQAAAGDPLSFVQLLPEKEVRKGKGENGRETEGRIAERQREHEGNINGRVR